MFFLYFLRYLDARRKSRVLSPVQIGIASSMQLPQPRFVFVCITAEAKPTPPEVIVTHSVDLPVRIARQRSSSSFFLLPIH